MDSVRQQRLRPLKRNLREQLVEMLGGDIVRGRLQPGDLLPGEDVLLARYSVSRTVLREALNVLSGKGLLDARPKRGTVVRPRSEWSQLDSMVLAWRGDDTAVSRSKSLGRSLDHLMEVRRIIEPAASALAAERGTAKDLARLAAAYEAMERAGGDVQAFMDADLAFHVACLEAAHNEFLLPIAHAIRTELMTSMRVTNRDADENRRVSLPLHRAIRDAIVARDPDAARLAMQRHLDDTERRRSRAARRSVR
ncbi:MAG TPA: FadR/GntR family transcriptional regulator [Acetobacteraceae bacterium]|jgi:GntR family galactonate operon transcriptional repressor|nr:FadR/GntR family transcriptional regulator [Acetobacteraceae bacterium]